MQDADRLRERHRHVGVRGRLARQAVRLDLQLRPPLGSRVRLGCQQPLEVLLPGHVLARAAAELLAGRRVTLRVDRHVRLAAHFSRIGPKPRRRGRASGQVPRPADSHSGNSHPRSAPADPATPATRSQGRNRSSRSPPQPRPLPSRTEPTMIISNAMVCAATDHADDQGRQDQELGMPQGIIDAWDRTRTRRIEQTARRGSSDGSRTRRSPPGVSYSARCQLPSADRESPP